MYRYELNCPVFHNKNFHFVTMLSDASLLFIIRACVSQVWPWQRMTEMTAHI